MLDLKEVRAALKAPCSDLRVPSRVPWTGSSPGWAVAAFFPAPSTDRSWCTPNLDSGGREGAKTAAHVDTANPVVILMTDLKLFQYAEPLVRHGFDDIETLLEIEDGDLRDLGMAPPEVVKLRKKLQELRHHREAGNQPGHLSENHPVVAFMRGVGLGQYAADLVRCGFDDMETLGDIEDSDLRDLGIPRGHAVKLKKRLREYCQDTLLRRRGQQCWASNPTGNGLRSKCTNAVVLLRLDDTVIRSWEQLQRFGINTLGELLHRHLFQIAPQAAALFPLEVRLKYREWSADEGLDESDVYESPALRKLFGKFLNAIGFAVAGLDDSALVVPVLTQLGRRHAGYGLCAEHWHIMGEAFNQTLKVALGDAFTTELEQAWTTAYDSISHIMRQGMQGKSTVDDVETSTLFEEEESESAITTRVPSEACETQDLL